MDEETQGEIIVFSVRVL